MADQGERRRVQALSLGLTAAAVISLGLGCSRPAETGVKVPLEPSSALWELQVLRVGGESGDGVECMAPEVAIEVCLDVMREGLMVRVVNRSTQPIAVDFAEVRWIDEHARPHRIRLAPGDVITPRLLTVAPDTELRETFSPYEKTCLIDHPTNAWYYTEPLVPWDLRSQDPNLALDEFADAKTEWGVVIPLVIGDRREVLTWWLGLRPTSYRD